MSLTQPSPHLRIPFSPASASSQPDKHKKASENKYIYKLTDLLNEKCYNHCAKVSVHWSHDKKLEKCDLIIKHSEKSGLQHVIIHLCIVAHHAINNPSEQNIAVETSVRCQ